MLANRRGFVFDNALVNLHRTDHVNEKNALMVHNEGLISSGLSSSSNFLLTKNRLLGHANHVTKVTHSLSFALDSQDEVERHFIVDFFCYIYKCIS